MFTQIGEIDVRDIYTGLPALLIIILMPLTFTIYIGIGAGIVTWVFLKVVARKFSEVHWLMWIVALAYLIFFAQAFLSAVHLSPVLTDDARPGHPAGRRATR